MGDGDGEMGMSRAVVMIATIPCFLMRKDWEPNGSRRHQHFDLEPRNEHDWNEGFAYPNDEP